MKLLLFFALTMMIMVSATQGQGQGGRRAPQFGGRGGNQFGGRGVDQYGGRGGSQFGGRGGGQRGRNCICSYDYRPVCGSNYITYGNRCQFNCEQRHNSYLRILNSGECRRRRG